MAKRSVEPEPVPVADMTEGYPEEKDEPYVAPEILEALSGKQVVFRSDFVPIEGD